ncbi:hypothetical protein [Bacillus sinesaloumensis]|uniref:hypothetical protein n=1 Tax=Litchfieldia sinesaloumensis TaxID=1926280 RepID=UPI0009885B7E|nr:hypothetical protein [Bacillus sinesaloumensis]
MKLIARMGIIIIVFLILTACANASEDTIANKDQIIDENIAVVEEAIGKASELDNGKYFVTMYGQIILRQL